MKLRERLRQLFHRFEVALTRVEDQSVRIEQGVDNLIELSRQMADRVSDLRSEIISERAKQGDELHRLRQDVSALQKKLGSDKTTH